jgi:hypothetical protein
MVPVLHVQNVSSITTIVKSNLLDPLMNPGMFVLSCNAYLMLSPKCKGPVPYMALASEKG